GEQTLVGARAVPLLGGVRVCSKINSDFAGGCLAVWLGASDEPTRQRSVRSEQQRHTAKQPQPSGAGRRLAICFVARRSQPTGGDAPGARAEAPRVLASGQAALPPKSEVIFEQTLTVQEATQETPGVRAFISRHDFGRSLGDDPSPGLAAFRAQV